MTIAYRNLADSDRARWLGFVHKAYGGGHILSDWAHLQWFLGGPSYAHKQYDTVIALEPSGDIIGTYGAIPTQLNVGGKIYSFCWLVSALVLPDYRNLGIGSTILGMLSYRFEMIGGIGFNQNVTRMYQRQGFNLFGRHTLRRFIKVLSPRAYELTVQIGFDGNAAQDLVPISKADSRSIGDLVGVTNFDESVVSCSTQMPHSVRVLTARTERYLNWRYFMNPRLEYECTGIRQGGRLLSYLVARHERFHPTPIFGTRILDLTGSSENATKLLAAKTNEAISRGDALIEFMFSGDAYADVMGALHFTELTGATYEWWPLVSAPIGRRRNEEFIFLASRRYPAVFDDVQFSNLYFTRGDSDRDRANEYKEQDSEHNGPS